MARSRSLGSWEQDNGTEVPRALGPWVIGQQLQLPPPGPCCSCGHQSCRFQLPRTLTPGVPGPGPVTQM